MKKIIFLLFIFISVGLNAQNIVISDDSSYNSITNNAILEIHSANNNKGILVPRMSTTQREAIPTAAVDEGLIVYDTTTKSFWVWDGFNWVELSDKQTLSFDNSTGELTISNGNTVTIPLSSGGDNWGSQVVITDGTTLTGNGTSSNPLAVNGDLTDDQNLSLSGNTLSIENGNSVDLSSFMDNTDDQILSITGHNLSIENGNTVTLPDNQTLTLTGNTLSIENGNSVDLSGINTDAQTLSLSGNTLSISGGNSVDLSGYLDNTDNQTLSLSGTTLSISGGNNVDISSAITSTAWSLTGNSGTTPGTNFIGTTDNNDLVFKTNNAEHMRLTSGGYLGIGTTTISYPVTVSDGSASRVGSFVSTETNADNYGVYGQCSSSDYYGYGGYFLGGYKGIEADVIPSGSDYYYGVDAFVSGGSGTNYAFYAYASGATGYGINASAYASDYSYGIRADGANASTQNFGGYFTASGTYPRAVYGSVTTNGGYGGYYMNFDDNGTGVVGNGENISNFYTLIGGSGVAANGDTIGLYGIGTNTATDGIWGGYFEDKAGSYAYVGGHYSGTAYKINGNGSVSTIVKTPEGKRVNLFAPEAPEILFEDYGTGKLVNGKAHIELDPILAKNIHVDDEHPLRVFIQLEGDCNGVYVTNKTNHGFDVVELQGGQSNVCFSWHVVANRADEYDENGKLISRNLVRFPEGPAPKKTIKKQVDKPRKEPVDPKKKNRK